MEYCTTVHKERLTVAWEMMEEGICFSPYTTTDHSGSMIFKSGDYAGQERCWSAPSCFSNLDWTLPAVCMGELSSWIIASLLGINMWTIGCILLPQISTESLAVIWPFIVIKGPAEYQDIVAQIFIDLPPFFTVGTRHSGLWASLGVLQT